MVRNNKKHSDPPLEIINWRDMRFRSFPEPKWIVQNLIRENTITLIASEGGTGKTWFALEMAHRVSEGGIFLNKATTQTNVLYLDGEMGLYGLNKRGKQLDIHPDCFTLLISSTYDLLLDDDRSVSYLLSECKRNGIRLLVIDTFRAFCGRLNEFDAIEIRQFYKRFYEFRESGITVVFLDHTRKQSMNDRFMSSNSQIYGSQDKVSAIDSTLIFRKSKNHETDRIVEVIQGKNRHGIESKPFGFRLVDTPDGKIKIEPTEIQKELSKQDKAETEILSEISSAGILGITSVDLKYRLSGSIGKTMMENTLKSLIETGLVIRSSSKPPKYTLPDPDSESEERKALAS